MKFDSFAAFIAMDGHGLYIWSAYLVTLVVITVNLWWPGQVKRSFVRLQKRALERQEQRESS